MKSQIKGFALVAGLLLVCAQAESDSGYQKIVSIKRVKTLVQPSFRAGVPTPKKAWNSAQMSACSSRAPRLEPSLSSSPASLRAPS